jgi:hypothetical protein
LWSAQEVQVEEAQISRGRSQRFADSCGAYNPAMFTVAVCARTGPDPRLMDDHAPESRTRHLATAPLTRMRHAPEASSRTHRRGHNRDHHGQQTAIQEHLSVVPGLDQPRTGWPTTTSVSSAVSASSALSTRDGVPVICATARRNGERRLRRSPLP